MIVLGYSGFTRDSRRASRGRSLGMIGLGFDNMVQFVDGEPPLSLFPLGFFGHDASAAIVVNGRVVACAAEERFARVKHSLNLAGNPLLPRNAIQYCLEAAGVTIDDVDVVAFYCDFNEERIAERYTCLKPFLRDGTARIVSESYEEVFRSMLTREVVLEQFVTMTGTRPRRFVTVPHHLAHAASTFYASGFGEALILTVDGAGEVESSLLAVGSEGSIDPLKRWFLPTSLATLYLIFTVYLGFRSLDDEYKVMGLASYGDPSRYRGYFDKVVELGEEGLYSTASISRPDFGELLVAELGAPRSFEDQIEERHADIAASLQEAVERAVLHALRHARELNSNASLCLAGGLALNCALNGAIARSGLFEKIWVQPAASDEGCSVGAALFVSNQHSPGRGPAWTDAYIGPKFSATEIEQTLKRHRESLTWSVPDDPARSAARELERGKVHGWFQGRMEFGPRALGNRSILADPRDPDMKDRINRKVKRREPFRPFAPAVLDCEANEYFEMGPLDSSPYMLFTVPVRQAARGTLPAVTHVDGTARVQTVSYESNPLFFRLISEFKALTGVPVVLNTSFNVRNEPIVCSPDDAVRCFLSTDVDSVTIGPFLVEKAK